MEGLLLSFKTPSEESTTIYIVQSAKLDTPCTAVTLVKGLVYPCDNDSVVTLAEYTRDRMCRTGRGYCNKHLLLETFDPFNDPNRWIHLIALNFFECSHQVPKSIVYRIGETLERVPFKQPDGYYVFNQFDIAESYSKFYHRVNRFVNRCICLLWGIDGIHRNVRILIARKLWKERYSWAKWVTMVWYETPK